MTAPSIPLDVLVRAVAALKGAKAAPVNGPISHETWADVVQAHSALAFHVERLLANNRIEVAA